MAKGKNKSKQSAGGAGTHLIAKNRRAFHDYEVLEQVEAGLVLQGTEVKSLRGGNISFHDAHARFKGGELWLCDLHIAQYRFGSWTNHEPDRPRKLLLHKRELRKLKAKLERQGLTLVPLELYFKRGYAKALLGVTPLRTNAKSPGVNRGLDLQRGGT